MSNLLWLRLFFSVGLRWPWLLNYPGRKAYISEIEEKINCGSTRLKRRNKTVRKTEEVALENKVKGTFWDLEEYKKAPCRLPCSVFCVLYSNLWIHKQLRVVKDSKNEIELDKLDWTTVHSHFLYVPSTRPVASRSQQFSFPSCVQDSGQGVFLWSTTLAATPSLTTTQMHWGRISCSLDSNTDHCWSCPISCDMSTVYHPPKTMEITYWLTDYYLSLLLGCLSMKFPAACHRLNLHEFALFEF